MKKIVEESSVVIAGYWNPSIIVPEWINQYLRAGSDQNIGIKLPLGNPTLPIIYEFDDINLKVHAESIECIPDDNDTCKKYVINVVKSIVSELKHTPVQAVGINFVYLDETPNNLLLDIFQTRDFNRIIDLPVNLQGSQVIRKICFNNFKDFVLNFKATLIDNCIVRLDFNFNKDILEIDEVNGFIERGIAFYEEKVQEVLTIYNPN